MQYMLMCCIDEKAWTQLPDSEKHRIMQEYGALIQSLVTSGQFRGGGQLRSTSSATTVRMKGGKLALTDGPFAETRAARRLPLGRMPQPGRSPLHRGTHSDAAGGRRDRGAPP